MFFLKKLYLTWTNLDQPHSFGSAQINPTQPNPTQPHSLRSDSTEPNPSRPNSTKLYLTQANPIHSTLVQPNLKTQPNAALPTSLGTEF